MWLLITGRPWPKKKIESDNTFVVEQWLGLWEFAPTGDFHFTIHCFTAPCFLHRWMQRAFFGFKWRLAESAPKVPKILASPAVGCHTYPTDSR